MTKSKIIVGIAGAGISAALVAAAGFFPDLKIILMSADGLVVAIMAYYTAKDSK